MTLYIYSGQWPLVTLLLPVNKFLSLSNLFQQIIVCGWDSTYYIFILPFCYLSDSNNNGHLRKTEKPAVGEGLFFYLPPPSLATLLLHCSNSSYFQKEQLNQVCSYFTKVTNMALLFLKYTATLFWPLIFRGLAPFQLKGICSSWLGHTSSEVSFSVCVRPFL